jgi:4-hydroxy-3-polyprenylbenzoate decarboxylase
VPSDAEIVIEGEISPQDRAEEGPFPEIVRRLPRTPQPVYHIEAITYRNDPILTFSTEGGKYSDILALRSTMVSLALTQHMRQVGSYPVVWINMPVESAMALCLVSLNRDVHSTGAPAAVARALFMHPLSGWFDKVFIAEHPCEAVDWLEILNQFNDQVHPALGCQFIKGPISYLADYSNSDAKNEFIATKLYIDATRPGWWDPTWVGRRQTLESNYPRELLDRIVSRWKELGLPGEPRLKKVK